MSWPRSLALPSALALCIGLSLHGDRRPQRSPDHDAEQAPSEWFAMQRAFGSGEIDQASWQAGLQQARIEKASEPLTTSAIGWESIGPTNVGGRVTALAVGPQGTRVFLGSANGGVLRSDDAGANWAPISDGMGWFSIGALALEPGSIDRLWVGTGESNSSVDSYDGEGLYFTPDAGATWEYRGLASTRRIAAVAVDPSNPSRVFVGAMGAQFSTGPDRGLYRSINEGRSWTQVLFVNDSTGVCDILIHPTHPETIYCATWERVRRPTYRRAYGPGCGIWRSANGGTTWTRLTNGLPAPGDNVGRIALAMAPTNPSIVYAQFTTGAIGGYRGLGVYRTSDGGQTWQARGGGLGFTNSFGGFSWYFGEFAVSSGSSDIVYACGVDLVRSVDGGQSFSSIRNGIHVDQHVLWVDPDDPEHLYAGNDGGFYASFDGGTSWAKSSNLPITQFYAGAVDPTNASKVFGGTQDNNTLRTLGAPSDWQAMLGGDGFQCVVDPVDPNIVLMEWQFCSDGTGVKRSTSGGPAPAATSGISGSGDRFNWNTPIAMDPNDHNVVLVGSQRVWKSVSNGINYTPVSADLTTNTPSSLTYGTLTTLAISDADTTYWAGTDDGRVWRSRDRGATWQNVSAGLPVRWVTKVAAHPSLPGVCYVTLSGFGSDEHLAHVYRTSNYGASWQSVSGNLPNVPANDIVVDPLLAGRLYLATDAGVWVTHDGGVNWWLMAQGMPLQAVFDLDLHVASRRLFAFTHGRSAYRFDLSSLSIDAPRPAPPARFALGPPRPTPSRGPVTCSLELSASAPVVATVHDVGGRRLRTLVSTALGAGRHDLTWDGADAGGRPVTAGVYWLRVTAGGAWRSQRVVLAR